MRGGHDEQHGQRHVIIVHGAQLGGLAKFGVDGTTRNQIGDDDFLVGDDVEKYIARHHRANHRAHLDISGAVRE